jgi:hypothetical protein
VIALRELIARFQVDGRQAEGSLRKLDKGVSKVAGALGGLAAAFGGAMMARAAARFMGGQIEAAAAVFDTAKKLGVTSEALQQFQYAARQSGVSSESASTALGFFSKNLGEAAMNGGQSADAFRRLGISIKGADGQIRNTSEMMPEIAEAFSKLPSHAEKTALAMRIFGRSGAAMLPVLEGGKDGVAALNKEFHQLGGGLDKEVVEAGKKASDAIERMKTAATGLKGRLAVVLMPVVEKVANKLAKFTAIATKVSRETNIMKYVVTGFGIAASAAFLKMGLAAAKAMGMIRPGAGLIASVFSIAYILLIVAAIAALGLLFQDIWVGMNGGKSATREWLNSLLGVEETNAFFEALKTTVDEIGAAFTEMGPEIKEIGRDLLKLGTEAAPYIAKAFTHVIKVVAGAISMVTGFGQGLAKTISAVSSFVKGDNTKIDNLGGDLGKIIDKTGDRTGKLFGDAGLTGLVAGPWASMGKGGASASVPAPGGGAGGGTVNQNFNVNVKTEIENVREPHAVGAAVGKGVRQGLSQADLAAVDGGG